MRTLYALIVPILAVLTALVLGAVIIALTGGDVAKAYQGLWEGSLGRPRSISDTLVRTTPYIFGGLAVALAFKGGLFNIGVEGQITVGSLATAFVGYAVTGVPFPLHLILAVAAGFVAGAAWGAIPGFLKAFTGAHEVIVTIMLNYVAINVANFLLSGPMKDKNPAVAISQTAPVLPSARLPALLADPQYRVHWGVVIGVVAALAVWWLLQKSTLGFEIRTVGANPHAARYAGIAVGRTTVTLMALSGGLAGLAGAMDVVGLNFYYAAAFTAGYGFDSIAVALLARSSPFGVLPSALLFGGLAAGSSRMQFLSQIPIDIIHLVQALVLIFVAAPALIRWIYRVRMPKEADMPATGEVQFGAGWGKAET
ncbi:MAG: ABC transporter permease [Chloroflexi bacterium]|nr:ABC transporter permease [Chloroflexota bacterium]MBV9895215.1 ABC transporter permease [Chloroflexota bacterium]